MMRIVKLGYVVHITDLVSGEQWYSGELPFGKAYVYKERANAVAYAAIVERTGCHRIATVEEHETTLEETA